MLFKSLEVVNGIFIFANILVTKICTGAGFVKKVNCLVGQESVVDISFRKKNGFFNKRVADLYLVEILVLVLDTLEHLACLLN